MKRLLFILILLTPLTITAGPAPTTLSVTMDLPTTNTNGTQLVDLDFVQVWCSLTSGGPYVPMEQETNVPPAPLITDSITMDVTLATCLPGSYGTIYMVSTATNLLSLNSPNSNEITRTYLIDPVPDAPLNFRF